MEIFALTLVLAAVALVGYAYVAYPLSLVVLARARGRPPESPPPSDDPEWPTVSITVPVYNEVAQIEETLEHLLRIDYPRDRLQILIVSDGSTDGTDEIVQSYADRGVELHRRTVRRGKTAAENAAASHLTGEIVVNTDASIRIDPKAIKELVARLRDPGVGLASGRDVSVSRGEAEGNAGEAAYVGYEMWVRGLETRTSGIVGASGCLYAIRGDLHRNNPLPENLSRDFAAALVTRENGYRAVSVDEATCLVPRTHSLRKEYRRKVRTMLRGIRTLHHKRHLLNPFRNGLFAWKLFSHKVCRWLVPWSLVGACAGVALLAAAGSAAAGAALVGLGAVGLVAVLGWLWPAGRSLPRPLSVPALAVWSNVAALQAAVLAPLGRNSATWEPTRRRGGPGPEAGGASPERAA